MSRLSREMITAAEPVARTSIRADVVDSLNDDQRVLYELVQEAGEIPPGDLYSAYRERVDEPRKERTLRTYLEKLEHYDLIRSVGEKRGRRYKSVGRKVEPS